MNILQVYPKSDYFTGAAIQLADLAAGLAARGHHVAVATRSAPEWSEQCRRSGLTHYAVPMRSEIDLRSVPALVHIIRRHHVEVVHCHKGRVRTLALMAGLFVKIPALVLNRGVSFPLDPFNRLGYTTSRVTAIVAVSESIKRGLMAQGVPAHKITVIYSATDTAKFHPGVDRVRLRRELGLTGDHYLITQIGVRSWKGNDDMLDAMPAVVAAVPRTRLLFVGANVEKEAILRDKAAARRLAGHVAVLCHRSDIPEILAASDVCVDTSYAGLGITGTLREALAVETPVIATDIEGNPELIEHDQTGLLVPPRNPRALATAVLGLIDRPDHGRALARAGRARVLAAFSLEAKVFRIETLYRQLLGRRASATLAASPAPARRDVRSAARPD
jgi:glycosyltransferase involved in cell wall biosynthesis